MAKQTLAELVDDILYDRINQGDSCVETCEAYIKDVKKADPELYKAMKQILDGVDNMVSRLTELNDEFDLGYDDI